MDLIIKFTFDEAGASAVEYAFLMAFIAVAIVASVTTFGAAVKDIFDNSAAKCSPAVRLDKRPIWFDLR